MRHLISDTRIAAAGHRSGGGVIVVVIALLTSLMFLGIVFYEFSSQEKNAAEAGSRARERDDQVDLPYAQVADDALEQLIIGAPTHARNSALLFGDSMIEDLIGRFNYNDRSLIDTAPHSGRGITVAVTADNNGDGYPDANIPTEIQFDINGDGIADWDGTNFIINFSPAANNGYNNGAFDTAWGGSALNYNDFLESDQGYTYPDINSIFLAYDGYVAGQHVIKPSFMALQYLPDFRNRGRFDTYEDPPGTFIPGIYDDPATARMVLSPHSSHVVAGVPGGIPRFLTVVTAAQSGDTSRLIPPFPFDVDPDGDEDPLDPMGNGGEMGIWSLDDSYDFPVDADGDGVYDSVRIDIGHAIIDLPGGRQVVPLIAPKIIELDGLFDLNSHGNPAVPIAASNAGGLTDPFGTFHAAPYFLHNSGWGYSPSEINPLVGLLGDPTAITDPDVWNRATLPHQGMYDLGGNSGMTFTRLQLANTEFAMLNYGGFEFYVDGTGTIARVSSNLNDHHIGRWGRDDGVVSPNLLYDFLTGASGTAPSPGVLNLDDDGDDNDNSNNGVAAAGDYPSLEFADGGDGGQPLLENSGTLTPATRPVSTPPVVHPLNTSGLMIDVKHDEDINGNGFLDPGEDINGSTALDSVFGAIPRLASDGSHPMVWMHYDPTSFPQYPGRGEDLNGNGSLDAGEDFNGNGTLEPTVQGVSPYNLAVLLDTDFDGMPDSNPATPGIDSLLNEPDEMILEPSLQNGYDAPFGFEELAGLHWSERDWDRYGHTSRLRQLMPFNFDWATTPVPASYIRSQYSVSNVDRLEFGHHVFQDATNSRVWEFNATVMEVDINGDGTLDPIAGFPPQYNGASNQYWYQFNYGTPIVSADPFRPEVRRLITIPRLSTTGSRPYYPQQRLNINRILANDSANGGPAAFDAYGNPQYRQLVPHPVEGSAAGQIPVMSTVPDMVHEHDPGIDPVPYTWANIATDPVAQEWWARYDRQRLARDIYVLLYTLGGPDSLNPTTTPYATGDTNSNGVDDMVEAMAQFAVNFVDQLDRDGVITKFEYDPDLSDGWTNGGASAIAYGVEHQQLVFSEVMYIQSAVESSDFATTLHDDQHGRDIDANMMVDDDATHRWLHIELRNASPFPVDMKEETWRLAREDATGTIVAAVDFGNGATFYTVGAGENVLISMHDGYVINGAGETICSDFYADYTGGTELEAILPDSGATIVDNMQNPDPWADIDLCDPLRPTPSSPPHSQYFKHPVTMPMTTGRTLVGQVDNGPPAPETFDLVLMRGRKTATGGVANVEWIEVDRFEVTLTDNEFGPAFDPGSDSQAENNTELADLNSRERAQPFDQRIENNPGATPPLNHSMVTGGAKHAANDWYLDPLNVLTSTPLYPNFTCWQPHFDRDYASVMELLSLPLFGADDVVSQLYLDAAPPYAPILDYRFSAGRRFMNPDGSFGSPNAPAPPPPDPDPAWVNRWYRLLEFLEVRERTHDSLAERLQYLRRTYGRMNLNGIRHAHVLAGLVDDSYHLDVTNPTDPTQDLIDGGRDWFDELLVSRDGIDHITTLPLPGLPQAKPFRNLSHINPVDPDQSEQDTILRSTGSAPTDANLEFYNLFEARSANDIDLDLNDADPVEEVDYYTRNRLLGKIHNLTTNRSHLFACWIAVEFFEAHQIPVTYDHDSDPMTPDITVQATQVGGLASDLPMRRLFCVIDRSRLEEAYDPTTGRFDFRQFIVYKRWID